VRQLLFAIALGLIAAGGAAEPVARGADARVEIDWAAGHIRAVGAGAADIRAPGPDIARIAAERTARQAAAKRLTEAARALPADTLSAEATVGDVLDKDPAAAERLAAAVARARDLDIDYSSDGSVEVTLALPLEAIRTALRPQQTPVASDTAPTAIVIDATDVKISPTLGVYVISDELAYAGPTVWIRDAKVAAKDPRLGARPITAKATAYAAVPGEGANLAVDLSNQTLSAAHAAGALVVVVLGKTVK
jgi:hypothetical protein